VLAAAGLLDGRRAATHWRYAELLRERFPRVRVDDSVLYVDDGDILTSAGTAAGIDACLHLVRTDHGAAIANRVARRMVVAPHRDGGQAQFIEQPLAVPADDPIARVAAFARAHLADGHTVETLAARAHLSPRQFRRRFKASLGSTPAQWLIRQRVEATLPLLENDGRSIEAIGRAVGFRNPAVYRKHFRDTIGTSPANWRQRFQPKVSPTR
jgi:AraC family transcriptional activator FtrA